MKVIVIVCFAFLAGCMTPQERMKHCNEQAGALKGDARKAFMSECLKA